MKNLWIIGKTIYPLSSQDLKNLAIVAYVLQSESTAICPQTLKKTLRQKCRLLSLPV